MGAQNMALWAKAKSIWAPFFDGAQNCDAKPGPVLPCPILPVLGRYNKRCLLCGAANGDDDSADAPLVALNTPGPGGEDEGLCGLRPPELVPTLHDDLVARILIQVSEGMMLEVVVGVPVVDGLGLVGRLGVPERGHPEQDVVPRAVHPVVGRLVLQLCIQDDRQIVTLLVCCFFPPPLNIIMRATVEFVCYIYCRLALHSQHGRKSPISSQRG